MKFVIKLIFLVTVSLTIGCQAGNLGSDFPEGCVDQGIQVNGKNLVLDKDTEQSLYLFHNISDKSFWLNHPVTKDPGASAGWASEIGAGNWSALTLSNNNENFVMTCSIIGDGSVDYLDCKNLVKVCKLVEAKFNSEDSGSYWVAESKSLNSILAGITSRGISW